MSDRPSTASAENAFAADLFDGLPTRYDTLAEVLSFGQNGRWRRELVTQIAASQPKTILDVATGTAGVAIALARRTGGEVTGVDLTESMLARGRERVIAAGLEPRIRLQVARAEELPFPDAAFDAVSFTYLLRYVHDPAATLRELARVLRPGGVLASLDFYVPPSTTWRMAWWLYTRTILPPAGLALGGPEWWQVGRFLGPNISSFYRAWPLARIVGAWEGAGMDSVRSKAMSVGGGVVMWGRKGSGRANA
ncbi:MAG TPA: class I SAM-dependent methyltransferase [Candidatus Micrarchaeaceae archaeon]|nr:class I SAM-dependent methyltransferase [Candidatus Micrarchaeaceae archaeon]